MSQCLRSAIIVTNEDDSCISCSTR